MALYKRPNSKFWWMKFTFGGELVQQSTKVANKRDAGTIESAYRTQLALGKIGIKPKAKAPAFKQAAEDYLKWSAVEHAAKPNTHTRNVYSCEPLKAFFGETKVDRIAPGDVEKFIAQRAAQTSRKTGKPISRDTINLELIALKRIFRRLISGDVLSVSPAREIKQLPKSERRHHVLTADEEKKYLLASPPPLSDVAALMLETGMRRTEIYTLKQREVELEKNFLQVVGGKTKASNRKVWLSDKAANILRARLKNIAGEYLFPKSEAEPDVPLFQINKLHLKTVKRIGFDFRLYDCRHTFATRARRRHRPFDARRDARTFEFESRNDLRASVRSPEK